MTDLIVDEKKFRLFAALRDPDRHGLVLEVEFNRGVGNLATKAGLLRLAR